MVTTEADVALAMSVGAIPSPQTFFNAELIAMRITGTGVIWRPEDREYAFRDPLIWLTERMCRRCLGLPVILMHPPKGTLDTDEFVSRVVGSIIHTYLKAEEVWGIARVLDRDAAAAIISGEADTSPACAWKEGDCPVIEMADGSKMLIEVEPRLLDHLAVCRRGKWTRPGDPPGVEITASQEESAHA